ncbi:MAG TPA: ABC-type transport auxiliary lipoprotein family protein [Burkholderiaceae bacterium]|nr:ABC-type transport auxiliary lipoprotein family protein [Burkholderiaceae bacterium]
MYAIEPLPVAKGRTCRATPAWPTRRGAMVAAWALLASGCSLTSRAPADEVSLHVLDVRPVVARATKRDYVLAISAPRAAPGVDSAAMAYVQKAHALDHYVTHRWADTPARMLGPLLTRTLEDTGSFRAVVQASSGVQADLRLDTEIEQLRQSFLARPSRVEFTLRAQLVDVPGRRVLATRYVEAVQEAPSDDAVGGVTAANAAVERALAQVAAFCVDASAELRANATSAQSVGVPAVRR